MEDLGRKLFAGYQDTPAGISDVGFLDFATKCGLLDRKLTRDDAQLIFTKVKLSNKKALSFERFQEGLRQMAVKKTVCLEDFLKIADSKSSEAEIFENERYRPGVGWSGKYLLATDRKNFGDRVGKGGAAKFTQYAQQLGVKMVTDWEIDRTWVRCDNDGWSYARDFKSFNRHLKQGKSKSKPKMLYFVRRRKWVNGTGDKTQVRRVDEVLQQMLMLEDRFLQKQKLAENYWESQKQQRTSEIETISKRKELVEKEMDSLKEEIVAMQQKKGTLKLEKDAKSLTRQPSLATLEAAQVQEDEPEVKLNKAKERNAELVGERDRLQAQLLTLMLHNTFPPKDDNICFPVDGAAAAFVRIGELWVESIR
jgi:hypothetical protein